MRLTKIDAAKSQLATAICLYFEDRDPVSVHTLTMAAGEIIDRLCAAKGVVSMRETLLAAVWPECRKEVADALNKARNFFKHASSSKPDDALDFFDDLNLFAILFATDGLRLVDVDLHHAKFFGIWFSIVEPKLLRQPMPHHDKIVELFGDIWNQPRTRQKQIGLDGLTYTLTGKLPLQR